MPCCIALHFFRNALQFGEHLSNFGIFSEKKVSFILGKLYENKIGKKFNNFNQKYSKILFFKKKCFDGNIIFFPFLSNAANAFSCNGLLFTKCNAKVMHYILVLAERSDRDTIYQKH